jgi:hypothetical protein
MTQFVERLDPLNSTAPRRDALARLMLFGWRGGLAAIVGGLVASFVVAGYFVVYWRNADMDFMVVYNALVLNDGKPASFDHPAYFTILSVKLWFRLLHSLGLLDAWSLSSVPSASNVAAFDAAMTSIIRDARIVVLGTAIVFLLVFAGLARRLVRDWRLAMLATLAFAFSGGFAVHMRILRSEMIAGCPVIFALMILIIVARRGASWRPLVIGAAAALCVLGLENKIHAILLIAALPVMILPFGATTGASIAFWRNNSARGWLATLAAAIAAFALLELALPLIRVGLDPAVTTAASLHPLLLGTFGTYQAALLVWIGLFMVAFAVIWRVSLTETLSAMFLVIAGGSLGLLALNLQYNAGDVVVVVNPLEKMLMFAGMPTAPGNGLSSAIGLFLEGVGSVLRRYTFVLYSSPRPTVFLTWLIFPGIVHAWLRGERQAAIQAAILMLAAIGIDALGVRRGLKVEYFIFTDPLIIIAGMVLLDRMADLCRSRWAYPIGAALVVLHIGISQAEPAKYALQRSGPNGVCDWNQYYMPLLPLPWCELPAKRA